MPTCGTSQAAKHALRWPTAQVTGVDISTTSVQWTKTLKRKYSLTNLQVHQLPIDRVGELEKTFASEPLEHWLEVLPKQKGQWDVVRLVSEVGSDPQAVLNGFIQDVEYSGDRRLPIVANPVQFDRTPPELQPAPTFSGDTDQILESLGMDTEAILQAKISGAVI